MKDPIMHYSVEGEIEWDQQTPNSRRKVLRAEDGQYVALIQWDAGYQLGHVDHHGGVEMLYILNGTFVDQNRACGPGTFIHCEPGTFHQPSTPDGVTFIIMRSLTKEETERIIPIAKKAQKRIQKL